MQTKGLARFAAATGIFLSVCSASFGIHAQESQPESGLRIATGPANGVYTQLARDIQKVCGNVAPLIPVPSKGGLENLMKLSANEADLGFAQIDLMQQMGKDGDQNIRELQAVMSMHSNLLHIITKSEGSKVGSSIWNPIGSVRIIRKFSELKGKDLTGATVVLVGSAQLLGQTLERQVGYGMKFLLADSDEEAVKMLQKNQAEAIFTTGGWPYPPISRLASATGLMLAEFDLQAPAPFGMAKRNYPNVGAYNLNFLSATNLLLTRPFKPTGERGKMVAALQNCILRHMDEFLEGPYQAAWKEIRNPSDTLGVPAFGPATGTISTPLPPKRSLAKAASLP